MIYLSKTGDMIQANASVAASLTMTVYGVLSGTNEASGQKQRVAHKQLSASPTVDTVYTLPVKQFLTGISIHVANTTGSPVQLRVWHVEAGASATIDRAVIYDLTIPQNDTVTLSERSGVVFAFEQPSGTAGGDLTGTYPNPTIADNAVTFPKIQDINSDRLIGRDVAGLGDPEEIAVVGGLEFNGASAIQRSALVGDVTAPAGSNTTTIPNDTVSNAQLHDMAANTIKGNDTGGTADPKDLTVAEVLALLGLTPSNQQASATGQVSTSSASYVIIPGMSLTVPGSGGDFLVMFSTSGRGDVAGQDMEYAIHQDAVIIGHTHRLMDFNSGKQGDDIYMAMHSQALITGLSGGEVIDVRYQTASGTFFVEDRSLIMRKVG